MLAFWIDHFFILFLLSNELAKKNGVLTLPGKPSPIRGSKLLAGAPFAPSEDAYFMDDP